METVWTVLTYLLVLHLVKGSVTNAAKNKPASMSSTFDSPLNAATAVDGTTTAVYPSGVIQTDIGQSFGWWKVDLERDVQDATVKIYFRTDYKFRRNGVQIYTSTTPFSSYPAGQLCHNVTGDPSGSDIDDVVSVTCPGRWRYLLVYTNTNNDGQGPVLDFGEVMVLICSDGTYGENCTKTCNSRHCVTMTTTCDRDGRCPGGCQTGWTGVDCTQACPPGKYGMNCVQNCGHCNGTCDVVDGHCPTGCLEGYCGQQCKNELTGEKTEKTDVVDCMLPKSDAFTISDVSEGGVPVTTVVGAVVGSVLVVVLVGVGILLCLIRQGRLQWVKVANKDKSNQNTDDNTQMRNLGQEHVSDTEHAHSSYTHNNDYAELNAETQTGNKDYDVIEQKHYQNA